ncbi:tachykinin-4 [Esox lucius]|uniref:tachykinin-4 n=1 Tax=Esox lucius TaxID=8010 RepID=UPI001476C99D|nr:tachykinin-4 [Esox lucius]
MELLKFVVLIGAVFAQVYGSQDSLNSDDGDMWSIENGQEDPPASGLSIRVADLVKKFNLPQFHGLTGRSSGDTQPRDTQPLQLGRKRNKGEMFVGLMGRRSSNGEYQKKWRKHQYH